MKFDFKSRNAAFGVFNNRRELDGESKIKAIDLPVRFQISVREVDMVLPTQGVPLSEFLFGPGAARRGAKPQLQTHLISPLKVHRKPEHVKVTIYDSDTDKRKSMTFEQVKIKDPVLEFDDSNVIYLSAKLQFRPGDHFGRISDNVEAQTRTFECKAMQPELFDAEDEDDGEQGEQRDLEEDEEEEEDEED